MHSRNEVLDERAINLMSHELRGASKANPMGARARGAKELRSPSLCTQACAHGALRTTYYLPLIHENAYKNSIISCNSPHDC